MSTEHPGWFLISNEALNLVTLERYGPAPASVRCLGPSESWTGSAVAWCRGEGEQDLMLTGGQGDQSGPDTDTGPISSSICPAFN